MSDLFEYDEGLLEQIKFLSSPEIDEESFEYTFNYTYSTELTDGTIVELVPGGSNIKVSYAERFKYIQLLLRARLCEIDNQVEMLKKGLCKIIPAPLLKCN
jgi:hypothetical protein